MNYEGGIIMTKKKIVSIVDKIRQEVMKEFTRIPGEDYEEWLEFIRYEVDERLKEFQQNKVKTLKNTLN